MQKIISADTIVGTSVKNARYVLVEGKEIKEVLETLPTSYASLPVEHHSGILTPRFFNAHCHLELSHLHGKVPKASGLPDFLSNVMKIRSVAEPKIREAIQDADAKMYENGIIFVGDISNTPYTCETKQDSKLSYHTFVEVFGLVGHLATDKLQDAQKLLQLFGEEAASITPHAPYSVSEELLANINEYEQVSPLLSIHNQESEAENELYLSQSGPLYDSISSFAPEIDDLVMCGKTSLQTYLPKLDTNKRLLFVHNTHTSPEDIAYAVEQAPEAYWCLCPNSNYYIEEKLPDFELFRKYGDRVVLGTDSLASNDSLSILEELKTVLQHTDMPLESCIDWACLNPARYFQVDDSLGSIEVGKQALFNLIENPETLRTNDPTRLSIVE